MHTEECYFAKLELQQAPHMSDDIDGETSLPIQSKPTQTRDPSHYMFPGISFETATVIRDAFYEPS